MGTSLLINRTQFYLYLFSFQILLVPNADYIPIYQGPGLPEYMKNEYLYNRCDVLQYPSLKSTLPEQCQRHTFSISAVLHNGALGTATNHIVPNYDNRLMWMQFFIWLGFIGFQS